MTLFPRCNLHNVIKVSDQTLGSGSGIKPAPAPPPKAGGPGGIGAIGAFAALQGGLMGSVATSAPKSKKQLIEEKIKELEQEHLM